MEHSYSHASASVSTTLQALCRQEESHYRITADYLMMNTDSSSNSNYQLVAARRAKCRAAMVTWCCTVVDYLEFERETVTMALNCLDRFLETTAGRQCLTTPRQYKVAGMTCLYTAIKAHEPEAIEPDLVVELSGNLCDTDDIEDMERTILAALSWRVNPPTALAFCRHLLALVPRTGIVSADDCESLLELAQVQTELAVADPRLISTPPSRLALASIFNALESKQSSMETLDDMSQLFMVALSDSSNLKNSMDPVFDVQDVLDDIIRQHNNNSNSSTTTDAAATATGKTDDNMTCATDDNMTSTTEEEDEDEEEEEEDAEEVDEGNDHETDDAAVVDDETCAASSAAAVVEPDDDEEDDEEQPEDDDDDEPEEPISSSSTRQRQPKRVSRTENSPTSATNEFAPIQVSPSALRYKAAEAA